MDRGLLGIFFYAKKNFHFHRDEHVFNKMFASVEILYLGSVLPTTVELHDFTALEVVKQYVHVSISALVKA